MIKKEEVKHIAKLARLGLTEKEIEKFRKELSSILDYVEKLKKVNVSKIEPTSHPYLIKNIMRRDEARDESIEVRKKLMAMSPDKEKGYIKVKAVFK
jgi:aspartyl-tRNA(Asn)/glutamyl-tRNA(Gln) amidotransferase subunit C